MIGGDYTTCGVCLKNPPQRKIKTLLAPEQECFYCLKCLEKNAEPIGTINKFFAFNPLWTISSDVLDEVYTFNGTEYLSLREYIRRIMEDGKNY